MYYDTTHESALLLDQQDRLKGFRERFIIPSENGKEKVYFLGNSLGLQPVAASVYIDKILKEWAKYGVEGFFEGSDPWYNLHDQLSGALAAIVGSEKEEIVVMNQLTVNLHLMLASFYRPSGKRRKIICESKAFPSDQYALETHLQWHGFDPCMDIIEISSRPNESLLRTEDIISMIEANGEETALVLFGGINYYTGQFFNIEAITDAAHRVGAIAGFDLAHAAGNVPLQLHSWNVDFACWCSYKYLNSGPGGIGAAFIHQRHHKNNTVKRLAGWWGYERDTRFQMKKGFNPVPTAEGWQLSTPSVILYAMHKASLDIFMEAGIEHIHEKGRKLSDYLYFLISQINTSFGSPITILTPGNPAERGCQLSLLLKRNGRKVFEAIKEQGFFADWREPGVIRIAPVPLYNTFEEVWKFYAALKEILLSISPK